MSDEGGEWEAAAEEFRADYSKTINLYLRGNSLSTGSLTDISLPSFYDSYFSQPWSLAHS